MPNTSATGGYLTPSVSPAPLTESAFEDFMHDVLCGLTGLGNDLVRPRFQEEPANSPAADVSWVAFGITKISPDTYGVELHDPTGDGATHTQRHEEVEWLLSFYGPAAETYSGIVRDGLQVSQNREVFTLNGMGLVDTGDPRKAPDLVKDRWRTRWDMRLTIRRIVLRTYQVLNLEAAKGQLDTEVMQVPLLVQQS